MTRLVTRDRARLVFDLLNNRFKVEFAALQTERARIAQLAYEDIYDAETRAKMDALPEGWLSEGTNVKCYWRNSRTVDLHFSGWVEPPDGLRSAFDHVPAVHRRFFAKHDNYNFRHTVPDEIGEVLRVHTEATQAFRVTVMRAKEQLDAALRRFTTVEKLIREWPEVAPFAQPYVSPPSPKGEPLKLPALRTDVLNDLFHLPPAPPVETAA
jgi:Nucleotide modification associated domain 5